MPVSPPNQAMAVTGDVSLDAATIAQMQAMEDATTAMDGHICDAILAGNTILGTGTVPPTGTGLWGWIQNVWSKLSGFIEVRQSDPALLKVTATQGPPGALPWPVDTELPAPVTLTDALPNPTTPLVGACSLLWDQRTSQWVREQSNFQSTTGEGTKTATFRSKTILNLNARSAIITVPITTAGLAGAVTLQLFSSHDQGTTYVAHGAVSASMVTLLGSTVYAKLYVNEVAGLLTGILGAVQTSMPMYTQVQVNLTGIGATFVVPDVYYEFIN